MNNAFQVLLSTAKVNELWGESSALSFNETGATIHVTSLTDSAPCLDKVQQSARKIAKLKVPAIDLTGDWPLEAQWHFWQGLSSPKSMPEIQFAPLPAEQEKQLKDRIKIYTWVKNLINQTPEVLSPLNLATQTGEFLSQLAADEISYKIISGEELNELGYVGIYEVGRGSVRPPALLELDFCPQNCSENAPIAALVGKGITFDSGGYSMKSSLGMLNMKSDMGGAATVAGALGLAILGGLNKRVKLYLCCAENLVSGHAYKLSDILKYRNGTSVEVVNTDAEGRLVLADGLIDASQSGAEYIIDAATLTGAAVVAVGQSYNAVFSLDNALADKYIATAETELDPAWRLPLTLQHKDNCPSAYADTANSKPVPGGGAGGASNAAGFLSRFLSNPESGWLHLDLAACYRDSEDSMWSAGATGRGVRSIAELLKQL
ncbi:aminopeptidase PepB [Aliikangiella sp. IMCC44653]